jgi:DNA replication and repair protein RecF
MAITRLDIRDFRNMTSVDMLPLTSGFNLIVGQNGSGKTSLIEAIYYLSIGRSFRSALVSRIIRNEAEKFLIFAHVMPHTDQSIPLGVERGRQGDAKIRIAGQDMTSVAELAELIPLQLINSQCFTLLDSGPLFRRKYIDWGAFYQNKDFLRIWREYMLALKQRNAALRQSRPKKELHVWTLELVKKANLLNQCRLTYIEQLIPLLQSMVAELLILPSIEIDYQPGWDFSVCYEEVLKNALEKDIQAGFTQYGPHRADLKIKINKILAKDILSRGQQKLFVCAMILAQGALLQRYSNKKPIYLIDDMPAELDMRSRSSLIALLAKQETQVFVTAVEREALSEPFSTLPLKMFHVEHGCVIEVS